MHEELRSGKEYILLLVLEPVLIYLIFGGAKKLVKSHKPVSHFDEQSDQSPQGVTSQLVEDGAAVKSLGAEAEFVLGALSLADLGDSSLKL